MLFKDICHGFTDLIFPLNCALCGQFDATTSTQPLCQDCLLKIPYNQPPFCLGCSRHLKQYNEQGLCPDCLIQKPHFDGAWILTRYEHPMPELIRSFKFHDKTAFRKTFALITQTFITRYSLKLQADLLIPIPIHPVRLRERTYNQSELLAQSLAELTDIPVTTNILYKNKLTPRQSQLNRKERWTNIQGAFKIENSSLIKNKNIFIVDDLLTTGATASEAANALKQAGAAKVELITLSAA